MLRKIEVLVAIVFVISIISCSSIEDVNQENRKNGYNFDIEKLTVNGISVFDNSGKFQKKFNSHLLKVNKQGRCIVKGDGLYNIVEWFEYYDFGLERAFHDEKRTKVRFVMFHLQEPIYIEADYIKLYLGSISYGISSQSNLKFLKDVFKDKKYVLEDQCEYDSHNSLTRYKLNLKIGKKLYYLGFNLTNNSTVDSIIIYKDMDS